MKIDFSQINNNISNAGAGKYREGAEAAGGATGSMGAGIVGAGGVMGRMGAGGAGALGAGGVGAANLRVQLSGAKTSPMDSGLYGAGGAELAGGVTGASAVGMTSVRADGIAGGRQTGAAVTGIGSLDMSVQHNYFAVMSNTLSDEDYGHLLKNGFHPGDMQGRELVTAVDEIKATLAASGQVITGYNDNLGSAELENITGGSGAQMRVIERALKENDLPVTEDNTKQLSEVLEMSAELRSAAPEGLSDGEAGFLLRGGLPITLENCVRSLGAAEVATGALSQQELSQLMPSMKQVVEAGGYGSLEGAMDDARHIIEHGLPLTADTLKAYEDIKQSFPIPNDAQLLDLGAGAIAEGRRAVELSLVRSERILNEAWLSMTVKANNMLLSSGYYIDIEAMSERVDELVRTERESGSLSASAYGTEQGTPAEAVKDSSAFLSTPGAIFRNTFAGLNDIRSAPIDTIAELSDRDSFTLNHVREAGIARSELYRKAGESYEALGTEVRADLGDSIKKAFRNVDDILTDKGLELSEANRRAVRILGYNRMELSDDNIAAVKTADAKVTGLIRRLSPGAVFNLIKEGKNPLDLKVEELAEELDKYDNTQERQDERYARYLLKLERNGNISEAERDGYIGIYRLFSQVEKSDGAVIGSLMDQGQPLTVRNLLSAIRSRRAAGMDYTVDDDFGGVERLFGSGNEQIDEQIGRAFLSIDKKAGPDYFEAKTTQLLDTLEPEIIRVGAEAGELTMSSTVEELEEAMAGNAALSEAHPETVSERLSAECDRVEAEILRGGMDAAGSTAAYLESMGMPVNADNLRAAKALVNDRGDVYRQLRDLGHNLHIAQLIEDFDNEEGAAAGMEDLEQNAREDVMLAMESADMDSQRLRSLMFMRSQLSVIRSGIRNGSYEIPMEIGGELTSVNLRVEKGTDESGMQAVMHTENYGTMSIRIYPRGDVMGGGMMADSRSGEEFLSSRLEALRTAFADLGEELAGDFGVMYAPGFDPDRLYRSETGSRAVRTPAQGEGLSRSGEINDAGSIDTSRLYRMAKAFLTTIGK